MSDLVKAVTEADFEEVVLKADLPVLVDFWAPWCGPCKRLGPVIDSMADEYNGKILVCKVNVDDSPNLAAKYQVTSIPTVLTFKAGEALERVVGAMVPQIHEMIGKAL